MLVLFETSAGYAIFKVLDENKLAQSEDLHKDFETPEAASRLLKLTYFHKFEDTTEALCAATALVNSKLSKSLKKTLRNCCIEAHEQLAVADAKLGCAIKDKLQLSCVSNTAVQELMRCIRSQLDGLISGVTEKDRTAMTLGLAHNLSRYKLKFSPDKVDTMVIQAVCLLDDLDKELNNYIMRAREWYGWHFPELGKIVTDNLQYIKTMHILGQRENAIKCDLSDILTEEVEGRVKEAAETSMGSEISEYDAEHMQCLCVEILELHQYRSQLCDYLKTRMMALAPNLTVLVGDLIGARLISKAGSLTSLAKHPASTLQILGAEKALFRALKSKKNTPKYGLIYHSQLVGQSSNKNKGKISRMLAAKASLATRVDALGDTTSFELGAEHKVKLEARLRVLEEGNIRRISGTAKAKAKFEKYQVKNEYMQYSTSVDSTLTTKKRPLIEEIETKESEEVPKKKKKKYSTSSERIKEEMKEEEPQTEIESVTIPKKKKKHSLELKTEDIAGASNVKEEEQVKTEQTTVSKKKKKHSLEFNIEQGEFSGAEIKTEPVVPKKSKKYCVQSKIDDTSLASSIKEEAPAEASLKETFKDVPVEAGTSESKKKKKKKKEKESEELQQTVSAEEVEEPVSSEKKKKKKKKSKQEI
ncbi:PREDICTED: nucleolar protein 58-like isoform X1 [Trachymyrmex cornetzi]|uniref:nucleolar protein 58-like isoform X1 n=1 Tax=Trachymyrmex cornetzi TaxID=471704 RepID=UPI00084EFF8B|nr:PREDICTED: nucleolar protein 58-like isoform X1 [Trachymyrmex cornetzi]